jgi:hypothetical protein
VVYPQDLAQPLEAFWGKFSWLAGFQFVTVNAVNFSPNRMFDSD